MLCPPRRCGHQTVSSKQKTSVDRTVSVCLPVCLSVCLCLSVSLSLSPSLALALALPPPLSLEMSAHGTVKVEE